MKVLLSIKPQFVEKIFAGTKKFEYRKVIFKRQDVTSVIIYCSSPVKLVVGEFEIKGILSEKKDCLWKNTGNASGISKDFYDSYFFNKQIANAIEIGKIKKYKTPKKLMDYNIKYAPQSFCYVL